VATTKHSGAKHAGGSASDRIDQRIAELGDWRGEMLGKIRALILATVPEVLEEWKWMGTPVWSHNGIITTGESYKKVVKLTFAKGASLKDPAKLFNSSLDGNVRRAIDIHEDEKFDFGALKALIREAVALNAASKNKSAPAKAAKKVATQGDEKAMPAKSTKKAAPSKAVKPKPAAPVKTAKKAAPKRAKR
jgi:hypothetical protein